MYYEVYIDLIFFLNLLMDYLLLSLVSRFFHCRTSWIRILLAAIAGAIFSCAYTLLPIKMNGKIGIILHGFCAVFLLRYGCGVRKKAFLFRAFIGIYLMAFLFGGVWETLEERKADSPLFFLLLVGVIYLCMGEFHLWLQCFQTEKKNLYQITIVYKERRLETCGFYDTGNWLSDPVTGKPVSVIQSDILTAFFSTEILERLEYIIVNPGELENTDLLQLKPHLLPFCSVGKQEGLLVAITLDELCIHTPREEICIRKPVFALQYGPSALESEYKVLLNSRFL